MLIAQIVNTPRCAHPMEQGELWTVFRRGSQKSQNSQARDRDDLRATRARNRHEELEEQDERTAIT